MQKHEFTVAETFGGLGIAITVSMADKPDSFPMNISGEMVAHRGSRVGKAARISVTNQITEVATELKSVVFNEASAMSHERHKALEAERNAAVTAAVNEAYRNAEQRAADTSAAHAIELQGVRDTNATLAEGFVALAAKLAALKRAKRSAAATKGHRRASKAGRA